MPTNGSHALFFFPSVKEGKTMTGARVQARQGSAGMCSDEGDIDNLVIHADE